MALSLHNYNIVRVIDGDHIVNCTVVKMCFEYAEIKFKGKRYRVPYALIDKVVGHELLMATDQPDSHHSGTN